MAALQLIDLFRQIQEEQRQEENNHIGIHIACYLGYFHIQRLTCTSKQFHKLLSIGPQVVQSQKTPSSSSKLYSAIRWLRELEILHSLKCTNNSSSLLSKISNAIYHNSYRIMSYEEGGDEHSLMEQQNLYEIFQHQFPYRFFGGASNFMFETCHPLDLVERELEPGDMFDDVGYNYNEKEGTYSYDPDYFEGKGLECEFEHCRCESRVIKRVFYVHGVAICGKCMDENCILKLRFCAQFYKAQNSSFEVIEMKYSNETKNEHKQDKPKVWGFQRAEEDYDTPELWGLKSNEFWARIWYTAPYNCAEIRFIGVGPRKSFITKKQIKDDDVGAKKNSKDLARKRKLALESIQKRRKKNQGF